MGEEVGRILVARKFPLVVHRSPTRKWHKNSKERKIIVVNNRILIT